MLDVASACAVDQRRLILISTSSPVACLEAVASVLGRVPSRVIAFSLKPVGMRFEAVLRLADLDEAGAERVAALIAAWPHAGSVRTEHQWMRP
jgi:hypothetical protein